MSAIRLARGATGRSKIIKFAGCYHGHADGLLAAAGSGRGHPRPARLAGRDRGRRQRDDRAALQRPRPRSRRRSRPSRHGHRRDHHRGGARQHGRGPAGARLQRLPGRDRPPPRRAADPRRGDDRLPGLPRRLGRVLARPGEPIDADLYTFGKVMGGGLPAAAFGGRAEIMAQLAPAGPVYQAGTLSGNPLACAAGLATLRAVHRRGVRSGWTRPPPSIGGLAATALTAAGVPHRLQTAGNMFSIFFTDDAGHRLRRPRRPRTSAAFRAFFHAMLAHGVYLPPSSFEAWFVSAAIDDDALEIIAAALPHAAAARRGRRGGRA